MPASYVSGFLGLLGLLGSVLYSLSSGAAAPEAVGISLSLIALPIILSVYRVVRGHFSDSLDEP